MDKMRIGQLKAREVCEGIKNGFGVAHFCVKYDCTEQEFETRIKQLYSKNERDCKKKLSALRANDGKNAKKAARARASMPKNNEPDTCEESATNDEVTAEATEDIVTVETATLEQLKTMESELSEELMQLESDHVEAAKLHRSCIETSRGLKKELEDIKVSLQNIRKKYEKIQNRFN